MDISSLGQDKLTMFGSVGFTLFVMSNWNALVTEIENFTPLLGQAIETEYKADMINAMDEGSLQYNNLSEGLESTLNGLVQVKWPDGVSFEQDDYINVLPDHVYVTFPGSEIVICDLINAKAFFESINWSQLKSVVFTFFGVAVNVTLFSWLCFTDFKIPWTDRLIFKDGTTGVVDYGYNFTPIKAFYWQDVRPIAVKALAVSFIFYIFKKTGIISKVWNTIKAQRAKKYKKLIRTYLANLTTDVDVIMAQLDVVDESTDDVESNQDVIKSEISNLASKLYRPY